MKTSISILLISALALLSSSQVYSRTVEGNGKVSTRTIPISAYDKISIAGSMDFEYEQSDAAPFLNITVDENLFEYIKVEVNGNELQVGPRREGNTSINLRPTTFKIKSNSKELMKLNAAGSGNFTVKGTFTSSPLELNLAGSCNVIFDQLNVAKLESNLAGSGNIRLGGKAGEASYNVAGSGNIKAYECKSERVKASVSGSGNIEANASSDLKASVAGSGNIKYKGNPQVSKSKMGSGSISAQ